MTAQVKFTVGEVHHLGHFQDLQRRITWANFHVSSWGLERSGSGLVVLSIARVSGSVSCARVLRFAPVAGLSCVRAARVVGWVGSALRALRARRAPRARIASLSTSLPLVLGQPVVFLARHFSSRYHGTRGGTGVGDRKAGLG